MDHVINIMDNAVLYTTTIFSSYHNMLLMLLITITGPQRMIFLISILSHIVRCVFCRFYLCLLFKYTWMVSHMTRMIELHVILPSLESLDCGCIILHQNIIIHDSVLKRIFETLENKSWHNKIFYVAKENSWYMNCLCE